MGAHKVYPPLISIVNDKTGACTVIQETAKSTAALLSTLDYPTCSIMPSSMRNGSKIALMFSQSFSFINLPMAQFILGVNSVLRPLKQIGRDLLSDIRDEQNQFAKL